MHNRLLMTQASLIVLATLIAVFYLQTRGLSSALYGGAVAFVNTLWLNRRVEHAGKLAEVDAKHGAYALYFNAVQRFVFVLVMLGLGLGWLKLEAVPLLATFGIAQLAYLISGQGARNEQNRED